MRGHDVRPHLQPPAAAKQSRGPEDPDGREEPEGLDNESTSCGDYPLDGLLIRSETRTVYGVHRRIEQGFYVMNPEVTKRSVINASLWDVMSTGLASYGSRRIQENESLLKSAYLDLLNREDFNTAITYATNDDKRVRARFKMTQSMLREVLG